MTILITYLLTMRPGPVYATKIARLVYLNTNYYFSSPCVYIWRNMENRYSVVYKKHNLFSTLQKKEVCTQLFALGKRIKIFHIYKKRKPTHFFSFFISINFGFYLINALVYEWVFFFYKYRKFWNISLEHKVERKPLFSEECFSIHISLQRSCSVSRCVYFLKYTTYK